MKVLVAGDSCIDTYVYGRCDRLSPEGPVPILNEVSRSSTLGMAGNTYNNMKAFCPDVTFVSNDTELITKTRFVDSKTNQLLLRMDINDRCEQINMSKVSIDSDFDLIVVSDYNKGFLDNNDLINIGSSCDLSVLDTKRPLTQDIIDAYSFIKLNHQEYKRNKNILERFSNRTKVVITMGDKGVEFLGQVYPPAKTLQTFDVSGAGDVFTAVFSYGLMCEKSISDAIWTAQDCCVKVIQRRGTCIYEKDMD